VRHVARKRFGQNFLVDHAVIEAIVAAIDVDGKDCMVEIGPGLGALTRPLVDARIAKGGAPIHVVEFDRDLVKRLLGGKLEQRMVLHEADALAFDFMALLAPGEKLRVVGNLPYNISSPLLFALLPIAPLVRDQHFMLQKEVVERMTAEPGTSAYGRLSVMLQVHYRMEHLFEVPAESFDPPPKVTSAVVRMVPDATLAGQIADRTIFAQLVQKAFSQRRKMLRNSLESYALRVELEASGISATARAEDISPAAYVDYANRIAAQARSISSIL
jgi:16S rRNA (adenine1518-N6/adenine1519-N6)-dimethyltransferase